MAARTRRRRSPKRTASGRFVKSRSPKRRRARSAKRRRPASRRRRRSAARSTAPRRRRRRSSARRPAARRRRKIGGRIRRPRVHYKRGRYYSRGILHGVRVNPRRRRRSRSRSRRGVRGNPFSMPTMGSVTSVLKLGAGGLAGWMGVNAILMIADKFGLADIKAKQSPTVGALINAAVRVIATPVVAKLASKYLKLNMQAVLVGGGINVVLHGVQDVIAANPSAVPDAAKPLLLGYDGFGDYVTISGAANAPRMSGFINTRDIPGGMRGLGMTQHGRVAGRVLI